MIAHFENENMTCYCKSAISVRHFYPCLSTKKLQNQNSLYFSKLFSQNIDLEIYHVSELEI